MISGYGRNSPPGTGATNGVEIITGLGNTGKGWLNLAFALHIISLCMISLMISRSESPRIPPPSVQWLLVSERDCGKRKRENLPNPSSFNGGFTPDEAITTTKEARCSTLSQAAGIANALAISFYLPVFGPDNIIQRFGWVTCCLFSLSL